MYLTYADYTEMGGTLDESAFHDLEFEAETYIDWVTFNRLQNEDEEMIPDRVKQCMYHLIKLIAQQMFILNPDDATTESTGITGAGIASQSNDGVSISYNVLSARDALELSKADVDKTIHRYLQGVTNSLGRKLLYRGLYPNE